MAIDLLAVASHGLFQSGTGGSTDYPAIGDVRSGTAYDFGSIVGTLELPAESDVRDGTGYGTSGTEFTGTLVVPSPPTGCAPLASTRSQWRLWPEREDVTLRVQSGPVGTFSNYSLTATCGAVKRRAITFKEMAGSAGVYLSQDRAWLVPDENLPGGVKPKPGDIILDGDSISWTIGDVTVGKFGETHKCIARALQIVNALSSSGQLKRAPNAADAAGRPALASYANQGSAVACRVQPEDSDASEVFDRVTIPRKYTAYLATPLDVQTHDQFVVNGATYTVTGFRNPSRIWDLMSLDLEAIP